MFNFKIVIFLFLLLLSLTFLFINITSERTCEDKTIFTNYKVPDWSNKKHFSIKFAENAARGCPGENHPIIIVEHAEADNWIHIVEVDINVPTNQAEEIWNLTDESFPWIFLDVPEKHRQEKVPYYNYTSSSKKQFYDNPKWGPAIGSKRTWVGRIYGVKINDQKISSIGGLTWGFARTPDSDSIISIGPSRLESIRWEKDKELIKRSTLKYQIK
jgi:hypothetical protein